MSVEKLREPKIPFTGGMVAFDWIATYIAAYFVEKKIKLTEKNNIWSVFILLILISIVLHYIYVVPTVTNYYLGISEYPVRVQPSNLGGG